MACPGSPGPAQGKNRNLVRAANPTTTITARSTVGDSRRPTTAPSCAADGRADRDQGDVHPVRVRQQHEQQPRDRVHHTGQDVLQAVDPLQVAIQQGTHRRDQQHPLSGAEVPPVHPGQQHQDPQQDRMPALGALVRLSDEAPGQAGLGDHQRHRQHDQDRHHRPEHAGRQHQQQQRAGDSADQGRRAQPQQPVPLAGQLAAVAVGAAEGPGHQSDGVADVGGHRRHPEGDQHRKGDQRAGAHHGVHRSGGHAGQRYGRGGADPCHPATVVVRPGPARPASRRALS